MHMSTMKHNPIFSNGELNQELRPTTILKELETLYYEDTNRFIPVTLKDIKSGPFSGVDLYVKTYIGNKTKYVLYYKGNDIFMNEKKEDLIRRNIRRLFIPKNGKTRYMQYIEANLKEIITDETEENEVKAKISYEVGMNMVQDIFANEIIESKAIDRVFNWVFLMIDFIAENYCAYSSLAKFMQNDKSIFKHCVNTTVIGLLFAKYTGLDINSMNKLGIGLMLHDIGLVKLKKDDISHEFISNEEIKTSSAWQHPLLGVMILEKTKKFAPETLELIRQHHEYVDGTGYPHNYIGREINLLAKYARIVDEYGLLITSEKAKDSKNPHYVVLNKMVSQLKNKLDTNLLKHFVKFLGTSHNKSNSARNLNSSRFPDYRSVNRVAAISSI